MVDLYNPFPNISPITKDPSLGVTFVEDVKDSDAVIDINKDPSAEVIAPLVDVIWSPSGWIPIQDASRIVINSVADTAQERQAMVAADGAYIRLVYGRQRIGAQIAYIKEVDEWLYVIAIWAGGENEGPEEILFDGEAANSERIIVQNYPGLLTQVVDPTIASIDTAFADNHVITKNGQQLPVSYSVLKILAVNFPSRIECIFKGLKVYDPRSDTTVYSTNPSLCKADYIQSSIYGQGKTVNEASLILSSNANDSLVGGEKRRELNLVITQPKKTGVYIEVLRTYSGCMVVPDGDEVKFVPLGVVTATRNLSESAGDFRGGFKIEKESMVNAPTVMKVMYTDTTASPWKDANAIAKADGVDAGTTEWRESVVRLPGITTHEQAYREAVDRLNKLQLTDLSASFLTYDESLKDELGDVLNITHSVGLTNKPMRIMKANPVEPGRWEIGLREYSDNCYSDVVQSIPDHPDTDIQPALPPYAPTTLVLTEVVTDMGGGEYLSRLKIEFNAIFSKTRKSIDYFKLFVITGDATIYTAETSPEINYSHGDLVTMYTPFLLSNTLHSIKVYAYSLAGGLSDALIGSITIDGV